MILSKKILDLLMNANSFKKKYPMVDRFETEVVWDGDVELPSYKILVSVYLNDPEITHKNMYQKGFDPYWMIFKPFHELLEKIGIDRREIDQVYTKIYDVNGEYIDH
jgi:hypothetical protein